MLGAPSCTTERNAPDEPVTTKTEVVYTPHEYYVGDNIGESAKAFKSFYDNCDWSACGQDDGYVYGFTTGGCGKENKSKSWLVNVAKKGKKDGYYQYLMYLPADAYNGTFEIGDLITSEYLKKNCQLQVIFTVNCLTIDGEIVTNVIDNDTNCPYLSTTKFYNKYTDWEVGMSRVYNKLISKDHEYHFQLITCVALTGKTYKAEDIKVSQDVYNQYEEGDIFNK